MDRRIARGFSFVELLVALSILVLTAGIAIPSFTDLVERNRALALADQLQSQLAHARALSVSRNRDVEICGSSDGENCDGGWNSGWLLRLTDEAEPFSRHVLEEHENLRLKGKKKVILFHSNGTSPLGNDTIYVCNAQTQSVVWKLVINRQGRVKREAGAGSDQCS